MKWLIATLLFLLQLGLAHAAETPTFFDLSAQNIKGKPVQLSDYKGKLVMVVNVASKCGFTPQYKGLESIYSKYKDQGLVILGFPSNDFGQQEPGTADDIQNFCKLNYGVTFPLFAKNPVSGNEKQPVYKFLTEKAPQGQQGDVKWNFEKFLVSPTGQVIKRWNSRVEPESEEITKTIAQNLPQAKK